MKNKAFTLTELLGVIIILGILVLVAFPPLLNQIKKTKTGIKDSTKKIIIDASKDYVQDNENDYETAEGITYCINLETLITKNYLNDKIKDENLNDLDQTKKVKMTYHNNKFEYEITDTCTNNVLTRNNIEVPIVTEDSGLYKSETDTDRFIYRGGNPISNWIELNEGTEQSPNYVKYRIISFEQDGTIKVVRNASIGSIEWDKADNRTVDNGNTYCTSENGCNVWGNQSNTYYNKKKLSELNEDFYFYYYPDNSSTNFSIKPNSVFGKVENNSSLNDYLNNTWINSLNFKEKIDIHTFYVGGIYYASTYTGGNKGLEKEKQEEKNYTWNGKIGLMNITEYTESSTNSNCTSVYSNYKHARNSEGTLLGDREWKCSLNNYNNISEEQWFLTALSHNERSVWIVKTSGEFVSNNAYYKKSTRPSFYLKSSITLTGEGTEENPYRIAGE